MEWFIKIDHQKGKWELLIDSSFFSREVVLKASYQFLDVAYFFFKKDSDGNFIAQIQPKQKECDISEFIWDYYDELINFSLRVSLEKQNQEIRNRIFITAIWKSLDTSNFLPENMVDGVWSWQIDFDKDIEDILKEIENDPDLKIDEEEINRILKEIEQESFWEGVQQDTNIHLDINWVQNAKKKFQNRS